MKGFDFKWEANVPDQDQVNAWLREAKVGNAHHSGFPGLAKIFMFQYFPKLERCIVHDTDMFFGQPAFELWKMFDAFNKKTMIASTWRPERIAGDKINAGVMLMDFRKM